MDLVIDIGNSSTKIALYDKHTVVERFSYDVLLPDSLLSIFEGRPKIERAIISTTRKADTALESILEQNVATVVVFDPARTPTPLVNLYRTPHTLGADRLAAAVAAWQEFPGSEILIFDIGTAMTIDRVSKRGEFLGGNISPGLRMRLAVLNSSTANLPLVEVQQEFEGGVFGCDTQSAILNGVVSGMCFEIDGYIAQNEGCKIFFTGGDALFFEKRIKKPIFANYDAVLHGLHIILDHYA